MDKAEPQQPPQPLPSHGFPKSVAALPPANHTSSLPPLHPSGTSSLTSLLPSQLDLDLVSLESSSFSSSLAYTSLEDLLPSAAVNSPTGTAAASSAYSRGISIRNRLAKKSVWASPRLTSSSSNSAGTNLIHRLWLHVFSGSPFGACIARAMSFINGSVLPSITRAINWIFQSIRV